MCLLAGVLMLAQECFGAERAALKQRLQIERDRAKRQEGRKEGRKVGRKEDTKTRRETRKEESKQGRKVGRQAGRQTDRGEQHIGIHKAV